MTSDETDILDKEVEGWSCLYIYMPWREAPGARLTLTGDKPVYLHMCHEGEQV